MTMGKMPKKYSNIWGKILVTNNVIAFFLEKGKVD